MESYPYLTQAVAHTLKALREKASLSKSKLSKEATVDRVYLLQLEQGKYRPTLNVLFFIAKALEMPAAKLVGMIEEEAARLAAEAQEEA